MARKRRVGRPKGSSKGPRLLRGKLSSKRAKAYMDRGLAAALKKKGVGGRKRKRSVGGKGRGAPGKPKSAAHRKKIAAGVRAAHKRGAYRNRKRGGKRRKSTTRRRRAA